MPAAALHPGDRLLVRPGERVPADGTIINGTSDIDESLVTGETLPRAVGAGMTLYAGSINVSGALTLRVTAAGAGTLVEEVERLLDKAIAAKSQTVRFADRASQFYAPVVHATAALTAIGWLLAGAACTTPSSLPLPSSSLPARARWRSPSRQCRSSPRARCSAPGSFSTAATRSSGSPRWTLSSSTRPEP